MQRHSNPTYYGCDIACMSQLKVERVGPEDLLREIDDAVRQRQENKYAFQGGLKELSFEIDEGQSPDCQPCTACSSGMTYIWWARAQPMTLSRSANPSDLYSKGRSSDSKWR